MADHNNSMDDYSQAQLAAYRVSYARALEKVDTTKEAQQHEQAYRQKDAVEVGTQQRRAWGMVQATAEHATLCMPAGNEVCAV